jgi:transcriptional regulator GlxA family with amidase domain
MRQTAGVRIGVVAVPGTFDSGLTMVLDVLRAAEVARPSLGRSIPPIEIEVLAAGLEPVRTGGGLLVPIDRSYQDDLGDLDLLVVPALGTNAPGTVEAALRRSDLRALRTRLVDWRGEPPTALAAACSGTFVLADAGLLDGRTATTSWWLVDTFARRYPKVRLDTSRMVVRDGPITTAGAAFAHVDLAVDIVARVSPELAAVTMRALLIEERPGLGSALPGATTPDELLHDFERWARAHLADAVSIADAAAALGTTRRTLERRVADGLGTTPAAFLQRLRIDQARHLRRTTALTHAEIAPRVGYGSAAALRAALRRVSRGSPGSPATPDAPAARPG